MGVKISILPPWMSSGNLWPTVGIVTLLVDHAWPRICSAHSSVCPTKGPLLSGLCRDPACENNHTSTTPAGASSK